jgi:hypothetical protein
MQLGLENSGRSGEELSPRHLGRRQGKIRDNLLAPSIHRQGLVPSLPYQASLLASPIRGPNAFPAKPIRLRKDLIPPELIDRRDWSSIAEKIPAFFGRVAQEWGVVRPLDLSRISLNNSFGLQDLSSSNLSKIRTLNFLEYTTKKPGMYAAPLVTGFTCSRRLQLRDFKLQHYGRIGKFIMLTITVRDSFLVNV